MNDLNEALKRLKKEDYIWLIFYFVTTAALISNYLERNWLITKNYRSYKTFKNINLTLLIISFLIYLYFAILNYQGCHDKNIKSIKEMHLRDINFLASTIILIGGFLYIYTELKSRGEMDEFILL